jgi:hypothetical protein
VNILRPLSEVHRDHLLELAMRLAHTAPPSAPKAQVILLADPLRKFPHPRKTG